MSTPPTPHECRAWAESNKVAWAEVSEFAAAFGRLPTGLPELSACYFADAEAESERRAEAGPIEVYEGFTDPREDAADRAYEAMMSARSAQAAAPAWDVATAGLARNDAALVAAQDAEISYTLTPLEAAAAWRALAFYSAPSAFEQAEGDKALTKLGGTPRAEFQSALNALRAAPADKRK